MQTKNIFEIHNTQQEKIRITKGRKFTNLDRRTRRGSEEETTKKSNQPWRGRRRGENEANFGRKRSGGKIRRSLLEGGSIGNVQ